MIANRVKFILCICVALALVQGCHGKKDDKNTPTSLSQTTKIIEGDSKEAAIEAMKRTLGYEFEGDGEKFINASYPDKAIEVMLAGTQYTKDTLIKNITRQFEYIKNATFSDFTVTKCVECTKEDKVRFDLEYGVMPDVYYKMTATYLCYMPNEKEPSLEENEFLAYYCESKWYVIIQ